MVDITINASEVEVRINFKTSCRRVQENVSKNASGKASRQA